MTFQGRSLDDMPLAAYTTGGAPDEDESVDPDADIDVAAQRPMTQQEVALALAAAAAAPADATAAANPPAASPARRLPSLKLPRLRGAKKAKLQQAAPFQPVAGGMAAPTAFSAVSPSMEAALPTYHAVARPMEPTRPFHPAQRPVEEKPATKKSATKKAARVGGRAPRQLLRDPRVLAGGTVAIGLTLLAVSLLGGGGPASGSGGPGSSQDAAVGQSVAPVLGTASVELGGGVSGIYTLTGATGAGPAVDSRVDATWTDPLGQSLGIVGLASQGTRTTDPDFVLSWTMLIDNLAVTFTSRDSECTVGMAVGMKSVHGNFVCKQLKSGDGKHVIDLRGEYTT